jgi:two-component sensor histidine kinase
MLTLSTLLTFAACLSYLTLIYLVISGGTEGKLKLLFTAYLAGIFTMQAGLFLVTISTNPALVRMYYNAAAVGFSVFIGFFYPVVSRFSGKQPGRIDFALSLLLTGVAAAVSLTGISFDGLYMGSGGFLVPNFNYPMIGLFAPLLIFWIWGMAKLVRQYAATDSLYQKNRLKYPLIGAGVLIAGVISNLTPLKEFPVDIVFYLAHAVIFGYAVITARAVDVRTAIRRGFFIFSSAAVLLSLHYMFIRTAEHFLSDYFSTASLSVFSFFIVIFLFGLMFRKKIVLAAFSRLSPGGTLQRKHLITQYSRVILPAVHPETIYKELNYVLTQNLQTEFFSLYLENKKKNCFELEYHSAEVKSTKQTGFIDKDHPFSRLVHELDGPVWIEELKTKRSKEDAEDFTSLFPGCFDPEILVPLCTGNRITGFFCFREKSGRKIYIQEDFILFSILASLTAAALLQARSFEELEKSLREKDLLLKEVHHRVKNNLQLISSLLELQKAEILDEEIRKLFTESQNRINSIAHVHESIYVSDTLSKINSREYIESLAADIRSQYDQDGRVQLRLELEDLFLDINQAIPLGLIINELITNAFKHAFTGVREGMLTVKTLRKNGNAVCTIKDNGLGFKAEKKQSSLGLTIVETLATSQLEGEWRINGSEGTEHVIVFPAAGY